MIDLSEITLALSSLILLERAERRLGVKTSSSVTDVSTFSSFDARRVRITLDSAEVGVLARLLGVDASFLSSSVLSSSDIIEGVDIVLFLEGVETSFSPSDGFLPDLVDVDCDRLRTGVLGATFFSSSLDLLEVVDLVRFRVGFGFSVSSSLLSFFSVVSIFLFSSVASAISESVFTFVTLVRSRCVTLSGVFLG